MHYLLIAINNSSNANGKSRKDNGYLCLILHISNLCLNKFPASFVTIYTAKFPLNAACQCILLQWFQDFH